MRTIIAGSRSITSYEAVDSAVRESGFLITEVVSGAARGVDETGEMWAALNGIPIKRFPADWDKLGRAAGFHRNLEMAKYAEAAIIIWDGKSRGTEHMILIAKRLCGATFVKTNQPG